MQLEAVRKKKWLALRFKVLNAPIELLNPNRTDLKDILEGKVTGYAEIKINEDFLTEEPEGNIRAEERHRPEEIQILAKEEALNFTRRVTTYVTHLNRELDFEIIEAYIATDREVYPE